MADVPTPVTNEELRIWSIEQVVKSGQFLSPNQTIQNAQILFNYVRPPAETPIANQA